MPDLGYNLFFRVAASDGVTSDMIGGPEKIMTAFGGDVVFRLGSGSLLSSTARRIAPPLHLKHYLRLLTVKNSMWMSTIFTGSMPMQT